MDSTKDQNQHSTATDGKLPVVRKGKLETLTIEQYLEKYDCCPRCGADYGVYTRVKSKGTWRDTTRYDGTKENTEMLDGFTDTWESKHIFCTECGEPVAIRAS